MNNQSIKSKLKQPTVTWTLITGILLFAGGCWILVRAFIPAYPQIASVGLGLAFMIAGIAAVIKWARIPVVLIEQDQFTIQALAGQFKETVGLNEISSYTETIERHELRQQKILTIYYRQSKVVLSSDLISNYDECKYLLIHQKPQNTLQDHTDTFHKTRFAGIALIVIGSFFLLAFWSSYRASMQPVLPGQLATVSGCISTPKTSHYYQLPDSKSINIHLTQYPEFIFTLNGNHYKAADTRNLSTRMRTGDTIVLDILADDYSKKLVHSQPLTIWDKTLNYEFIPVYGLRYQGKTYLTLTAYNEQQRQNAFSGGKGPGGVLGLFSLVTGIVLLLRNKRPDSYNLYSS